MILRADKTNKTVIMENFEYLDKMNNLIGTKKNIQTNKIRSNYIFLNKNKEIIDSWKKNNFISPNTTKKTKNQKRSSAKNIWFTKIT